MGPRADLTRSSRKDGPAFHVRGVRVTMWQRPNQTDTPHKDVPAGHPDRESPQGRTRRPTPLGRSVRIGHIHILVQTHRKNGTKANVYTESLYVRDKGQTLPLRGIFIARRQHIVRRRSHEKQFADKQFGVG